MPKQCAMNTCRDMEVKQLSCLHLDARPDKCFDASFGGLTTEEGDSRAIWVRDQLVRLIASCGLLISIVTSLFLQTSWH